MPTTQPNLFLLTLKFHFLQLAILAMASITMWQQNHILFGSPLATGTDLIWFPGPPVALVAVVSTAFWYGVGLPNIKQLNVQVT